MKYFSLLAIAAACTGEPDVSVHESALEVVNCNVPGACPEVVLWGDPEATIGNYHGFADPTLIRHPLLADRMWLAYSWPHVRSVSGVLVPAVDAHLARSDNGGQTFVYTSTLWNAFPL